MAAVGGRVNLIATSHLDTKVKEDMTHETINSFSWTEDTLLDGRVRLRQPYTGYRTALDPVLLAAAVPARPGDRVADIGTGTGAAALCLLARVQKSRITGVELQPTLAELATLNSALNGSSERFKVIIADVLNLVGRRQIKESGGREYIMAGFDHVMSNPPFSAAGTPSSNPARAIAHGAVDLKAWVSACIGLLQPHGSLTLIHRADTFDRLLVTLMGEVGGIEIIPLWPRAGVPAHRLIVRGRKGSCAPTVLHAGLILHTASGYTVEAEGILRYGHPLFITNKVVATHRGHQVLKEGI